MAMGHDASKIRFVPQVETPENVDAAMSADGSDESEAGETAVVPLLEHDQKTTYDSTIAM